MQNTTGRGPRDNLGIVSRPRLVQQVLAAGGGAGAGLFPAPGRDLGVIPGQEDVRYLDPAEDRRPGVARVVQQAVGKGFLRGRVRIDYPRNEPGRRVENRQRRQLAAGQDEIADRELFNRIELGEAFVNALVMAADQDQAVELCELLGCGVRERATARRGNNDRSPLVWGGRGDDRVEHTSERLDPKHHPATAAIRNVVGAFAAAQNVEQMMVVDCNGSGFDRAPDNRKPDERRENLREERNDVDREHGRLGVLGGAGVAPLDAKGGSRMAESEQIFLSDEVLAFMRNAAQLAGQLREPFITVRTLLIALLEEPTLGPALEEVLPREKLENYELPEDAGVRLTASRVPEPNAQPGERPALLRFNTLAFKVPDGSKSVWLSREAFNVWNEAAKRVPDGEKFLPKHVAFGIAADAIRSPGVLAAMHISPGDVTEVLLKL